jgi:hypothetical protein
VDTRRSSPATASSGVGPITSRSLIGRCSPDISSANARLPLLATSSRPPALSESWAPVRRRCRPASDIEAIQRVVETRRLVERWPFLQTGQGVLIEIGPLRALEGIVLTFRNTHRLVASVPLLQRAVAVELDATWVSIPPQTLASCAIGNSGDLRAVRSTGLRRARLGGCCL